MNMDRIKALQDAIVICERNIYMSPDADPGGEHGGTSSCEYGCGHVIAEALKELLLQELARETKPD